MWLNMVAMGTSHVITDTDISHQVIPQPFLPKALPSGPPQRPFPAALPSGPSVGLDPGFKYIILGYRYKRGNNGTSVVFVYCCNLYFPTDGVLELFFTRLLQ